MWQYLLDSLIIPGEVAVGLFTALILAVFIGLCIAMIYRNTHRGLNYEPSFVNTLVLIAPIVALVMHFIRGDLVLSLGLIGSLSIIRFRTPIKDTRDMVYLFWAIAVGLGCGTANWTISLMATLFISVVVFVLFMFEYGVPRHSDFVLVVSAAAEAPAVDVAEIIRRHTTRSRIRSHEVTDDSWEIVYELRFSKRQETETETMLREIRRSQGVDKVSLLAPQLALPM